MRSYTKELKSSEKALQDYNKAISILDGLNVQAVMAELNTPSEIPTESANYIQLVALDNAEREGFSLAIKTLFSLTDIEDDSHQGVPDIDFGSKERLINDGYGEDE